MKETLDYKFRRRFESAESRLEKSGQDVQHTLLEMFRHALKEVSYTHPSLPITVEPDYTGIYYNLRFVYRARKFGPPEPCENLPMSALQALDAEIEVRRNWNIDIISDVTKITYIDGRICTDC